MVVRLLRGPFTVDEYYRLGETGVLAPDDRVELLDGEVVWMNPIGRRHAGIVARLQDRLQQAVSQRAIVWVQNPIRLTRQAAPQPDLCLLAPRRDFYCEGLPEAEHVFLVVEVADTTGEDDRKRKIPLYARAGLPEAWIVDIDADRIEVYRQPGPDGYSFAGLRIQL